MLLRITHAFALACALLISTTYAANSAVDEAAYFVEHGHFHYDPLGPRIEGTIEDIDTHHDIGIEIYAGTDIASAEALGKELVALFKAIEKPDYPVKVTVRTITSPLAKETIISTFFIDGVGGWRSPTEYKAEIAHFYARARDGLPRRFYDMAADGKIWTKYMPRRRLYE